MTKPKLLDIEKNPLPDNLPEPMGDDDYVWYEDEPVFYADDRPVAKHGDKGEPGYSLKHPGRDRAKRVSAHVRAQMEYRRPSGGSFANESYWGVHWNTSPNPADFGGPVAIEGEWDPDEVNRQLAAAGVEITEPWVFSPSGFYATRGSVEPTDHARRQDLLTNGSPTISADEFDLIIDPEVMESGLEEAEGIDWDEVPVSELDLSEPLYATEETLKTTPIRRVAIDGEPFRPGYEMFVIIDSEGRNVIIDGHHRAAMYRTLEAKTMPARIFDTRTAPRRFTVEVETSTYEDLQAGRTSTGTRVVEVDAIDAEQAKEIAAQMVSVRGRMPTRTTLVQKHGDKGRPGYEAKHPKGRWTGNGVPFGEGNYWRPDKLRTRAERQAEHDALLGSWLENGVKATDEHRKILERLGREWTIEDEERVDEEERRNEAKPTATELRRREIAKNPRVARIPEEERCPRCYGSGYYQSFGPCFGCGGTGRIDPKVRKHGDKGQPGYERLHPNSLRWVQGDYDKSRWSLTAYPYSAAIYGNRDRKRSTGYHYSAHVQTGDEFTALTEGDTASLADAKKFALQAITQHAASQEEVQKHGTKGRPGYKLLHPGRTPKIRPIEGYRSPKMHPRGVGTFYPGALAPMLAPLLRGKDELAGRHIDQSLSRTVRPKEPIHVTDVDEAVRLLSEGYEVDLEQVDEVATLLDKMVALVDRAQARGSREPSFDLCKVSVRGTNVFCADSLGIPRLRMPQLSGRPNPGSRAAMLPKDDYGRVDLGPAFREHLEARGVDVTTDEVLASHLRASQNEISGVGVSVAHRQLLAGDRRKLFVSRDNYIIDGHHRWAARVAEDLRDGYPDAVIEVERVDMPILHVLAAALNFSKSWGVPGSAIGQTDVTKHGNKGDPGYKLLHPGFAPRFDREPELPRHTLLGGRGLRGGAPKYVRVDQLLPPYAKEDEVVEALVAEAEREAQPVTDDLEEANALTGAYLKGLKWRVKKPDGVMRKLRNYMEDAGLSPIQAKAKVGDVLRFTVVHDGDNLITTMDKTIAHLRAKGHRTRDPERKWVRWRDGEPYRGINIEMQSPFGFIYELQFHTEESFEMKDSINHKMYEEARLKTTPGHRVKFLNYVMAQNSATLVAPKGAMERSSPSKMWVHLFRRDPDWKVVVSPDQVQTDRLHL